MCIIAVISHKQPLLSERMLKKCWNLNPDGAGVMYTDQTNPSKIHVHKGFMDYKSLAKFWKGYRATHDDTRTSGFTVIHFRIGTSGGKTPAMTHPFILYNDNEDTTQALAHNGMIQIQTRVDASDTAVFCEKIRDFTKSVEWVDCDFTRLMVEEFIGDYNKLVVLTGDKCHIFNPQSGDIDPRTGIWWSNAGWRSRDPGTCDPRQWRTNKPYKGVDDWEDYYLAPPVTKAVPPKPAQVMDGTLTDVDEDCEDYYDAIKHTAMAFKVGTPPLHRPNEVWRFHMKWECWICTEGERKGAIAMPHEEYICD